MSSTVALAQTSKSAASNSSELLKSKKSTKKGFRKRRTTQIIQEQSAMANASTCEKTNEGNTGTLSKGSDFQYKSNNDLEPIQEEKETNNTKNQRYKKPRSNIITQQQKDDRPTSVIANSQVSSHQNKQTNEAGYSKMSSSKFKKNKDSENLRRLSDMIQEEKTDLYDEIEPIKFCKGELIGSGAYGKVYQGLDETNGRLLAIKCIHLSMNEEQLKKEIRAIKHEISMLKVLNHPNIVKYYYTDISKEGRGVDIVLEFVPGGSIRQLLDQFEAFDERLVKIYTRQMLEGLKYLHDNGIIHRDLKCANVLVDNMGVIKLSDFGASKRIEQALDSQGNSLGKDYALKSVRGSPYWMAPEVVRKTGHGCPADIWGLGCCVIEMLTSKPPWYEFGKDAKTIMNVIKGCNKPPDYPDKISKECKDFLDYCFEQDQAKRATAQELLFHPFVLMKNPKAIQESLEAAKLMAQSHISFRSSLWNSNVYNNGISPNSDPRNPYFLQNSFDPNKPSNPHQQSIQSINSIQFAFNSQLNLQQFLQQQQQQQQQVQKSSNLLNVPTANQMLYHNPVAESQTIPHIGHRGFDPQSLALGNVINNDSNQAIKPNSSFSSNSKLTGFAERLKHQYEKQKQGREEIIMQNWVKPQTPHIPPSSPYSGQRM